MRKRSCCGVCRSSLCRITAVEPSRVSDPRVLRLTREMTVRVGVPNLYFAAMVEIEALGAARS